jgi:hypothetical protein
VEANANFDSYGLKLAFSLLYDSIGKAESCIAKRRKGQRRDKSIGQLFLHASQVMRTLYSTQEQDFDINQCEGYYVQACKIIQSKGKRNCVPTLAYVARPLCTRVPENHHWAWW